MRTRSITAMNDEGFGATIMAGLIRSAVHPLQALIAAPTLLFLAALTAMLFSHPEISFHELNRVTFGFLVVGVLGRAVAGDRQLQCFDRASWPMMALTAVAVISLIGRPVNDGTWGVLATKYLFPFALFHIAQLVFTGEREIRRFEIFALVILSYLSFTAIAFLVGAHGLIFPRFILDDSLGIHAERARGPFLQAVANGVSLNLLALIVLHGYRRGTLRSRTALMVLASVPIAILATMTRAVWLSFAGSLLALLFLSRNKQLRLAFTAMLLVGAIGLGFVLSTTQLGRRLDDRLKDGGPVDFRAAVYAGSWNMFQDRPLIGWGFHQMPAELPRYVGEFHDKLLFPHDTYLEILVENGLLGFFLYAWLMWELWRLGRGKVLRQKAGAWLDPDLRRAWPIFLAVYWVNATFVVMSYYFVNGLLFTVAGIVAARRRAAEVGS